MVAADSGKEIFNVLSASLSSLLGLEEWDTTMEDTSVNVASIDTITRLASEFGPFLFSILFLLVITTLAHRWYATASAQNATDPNMLKTCRSWFICSIVVGLACTVISIGWWFHQHLTKVYVYQVTLAGLTSQQKIATDYFYRIIPEAINGDPLAMDFKKVKWDTDILIIQNSEFAEGQPFNVDAQRYPDPQPACAFGDPIVFPLEFHYEGASQAKYLVQWAQNDPPKLLSTSARKPAGTP